MNCPSDDALRGLLRQNPVDPVSSELLQHLVSCSACRNRCEVWGESQNLNKVLFRTDSETESSPQPPPLPNAAESKPTDEPTVTYHPAPNRRIGGYELIRKIGRGGGGEVYEARHLRLHRHDAVKILAQKHLGDEHVKKRFLREMKSIGQLSHPNIVRAFDAGDSDGVLYLAMELIDGPDIETLARRVPTLPIADACEIVRQASIGVQHIQDHGLVHRDLKPSNLLLSASEVKVADLGMARLNDPASAESQLTDEFAVMGTGDYIAPEQSDGAHSVDIRADIYSLGCTLYRLIAGRPPYGHLGKVSVMKKLIAHINEPIPDISQFRHDVPEGLKVVLRKMMAKEKQDRYALPRDVASALAPYCEGAHLIALSILFESRLTGKPATSTRSSGTSDSPSPQTTAPMASSTGYLNVSPYFYRFVYPLIAACLIIAVYAAISSRNPPSVAGKPVSVSTDLNQKSNNVAVVPKFNSESDSPATKVRPSLMEPASQIPKPGTILERWHNEFGMTPEESIWAGRSGLGSWQLNEDLRALLVQTTRTTRFVKLGTLNEADLKLLQIGCDAQLQSKDGSFGFYFGFNIERDDHPRFTRFQAINFTMKEETADGRRVIATRHLATIEAESGRLTGARMAVELLSLPPHLDKIKMQLVIRDSTIQSILLAGVPCPKLCSEEPNFQYQVREYCGDFGIYVQDSTVWFSNPHFRKSLK